VDKCAQTRDLENAGAGFFCGIFSLAPNRMSRRRHLLVEQPPHAGARYDQAGASHATGSPDGPEVPVPTASASNSKAMVRACGSKYAPPPVSSARPRRPSASKLITSSSWRDSFRSSAVYFCTHHGFVVGVQQLHLALQVHAPWSGTAESARRGRSCP